MRAKKLLTSRHIFRYAVPARTVTKSTGTGGSELRESPIFGEALGTKSPEAEAFLATWTKLLRQFNKGTRSNLTEM